MSDVSDDRHPLDFYPDEETGDEYADSLVLLDKARAFLAQAETLPDIGAVREIAERARRYAAAAKKGREAENHAVKLRLDAERKAGILLREIEKHRGFPDLVRSDDPTALPSKLSDLGISKQQSSDWQAMARLPEDVYHGHVRAVVTAKRSLTTAGVVDVARKLERAARIAELPPVVLTRPDVRIEIAEATALPLDDEVIDLIVCSPPYGVGVPYADGGDVPPEQWPAWLEIRLREAHRVTKHRGRLALNVPLDTAKGGFRPTWPQACVAALAAGWTYRFAIDWHEDNSTKGGWANGSQSSAARPYHISKVETIGVFFKGEWGPSSDNDDDITADEFKLAGKGPWEFSGEARPWEQHEAAYPLELPLRLIPYLSRRGDTVLDMFLGSGTTAEAALDRGRRVIGFDRSPTYVESSKRRIAAWMARQARTTP